MISQICQVCIGQARERDPFTLQEDVCRGCDGEPHMVAWEEITVQGILGASLLRNPYIPDPAKILGMRPAPDPFIQAGYTAEQAGDLLASAQRWANTMGEAMAIAGAVATTTERLISWAKAIMDPGPMKRERRIRVLAYRKERSQGKRKRRRRREP